MCVEFMLAEHFARNMITNMGYKVTEVERKECERVGIEYFKNIRIGFNRRKDTKLEEFLVSMLKEQMISELESKIFVYYVETTKGI